MPGLFAPTPAMRGRRDRFSFVALSLVGIDRCVAIRHPSTRYAGEGRGWGHTIEAAINP